MPALNADWPGLRPVAGGMAIEIPLASEGRRIILGHVLRNAAEHGADTGTLRASDADEARTLTVHDNGCGVSPGNAARVFDPFFTNRPEEGGTGIGLTVVRSILQAHHTDIALAKSAEGALFRLTFPLGRNGRRAA